MGTGRALQRHRPELECQLRSQTPTQLAGISRRPRETIFDIGINWYMNRNVKLQVHDSFVNVDRGYSHRGSRQSVSGSSISWACACNSRTNAKREHPRSHMEKKMKMNFKALVGAVAGLAMAATATFAAEITGAGASFPFPIYAKWAAVYKGQSGTSLNYQSIGSGGGIAQIKAKTVAFGATDKPLDAQGAECRGPHPVPHRDRRRRAGDQRAGHHAGPVDPGRQHPGRHLPRARSRAGTIRPSPSSILASIFPTAPSPWCIVRTARARPSSSRPI